MGYNDQRLLNEIQPIIDKNYGFLIHYHGKANADKVVEFAKLFARLGRTCEAKDIILKAVNKNWEHKKCQEQIKPKLPSGFLSELPLLGLFLKLLKKLLK